MTYLFCSWEFVPINFSHLFHSSPYTLSWQSPICCLYLWICFCFVMLVHLIFFFLIPCISKIIWYLCFSVWFISLSIIPSRSMHVVTNGKISLFYGWVMFHSSLSIHLSVGTLTASISWGCKELDATEWLNWTDILVIVNNATINVGVH